MMRVEFEHEMTRLASTWPHSFPTERSKVIWVAVKDQEHLWFKKLVTDYIASNKQAPLPSDIIKDLSAYEKQKVLNTVRIDYKMRDSVFSSDERKEMFEIMKRAATGVISREQAMHYAEMVANSLQDRGIRPVDWKRRHPITLDWDDSQPEPPGAA